MEKKSISLLLFQPLVLGQVGSPVPRIALQVTDDLNDVHMIAGIRHLGHGPMGSREKLRSLILYTLSPKQQKPKPSW